MKICVRLFIMIACIAFLPTIALAEWQAVEREEPYSIAGQTGAELYQSIGERGPKVGVGVRTIAYTNFKLTWSRKYQPQGDACVLASARPKLVITYALPEPSEELPALTGKLWQTFIAGVRAHERVHGEMIKDMVHKIEAVSVGMTVSGDPGCRRIRTELTKRLGELSLAQRRQSRDFDKVELSKGGNIHQLILDLVNGR